MKSETKPLYVTPVKMYPPAADPSVVDRLKRAAAKDGVSVSEWIYSVVTARLPKP